MDKLIINLNLFDMKKLIPFLFVFLLLASCEKDPDLDKVQNEYVTYTQYDKTANFSKGSTFFIADSVLAITSDSKASYLAPAIGDYIINAYVTNMEARGYTRVMDKADATYGMQVSFVESTYYFANNPYWWNSCPWYWSPSYWGPWYGGGWYYPYQFIYSYTNGALIGELVDLTTASTTTTDNKLTVIWNDYITGLLSGNSNVSEANTVKAINQSFIQSPYLKFAR